MAAVQIISCAFQCIQLSKEIKLVQVAQVEFAATQPINNGDVPQLSVL